MEVRTVCRLCLADERNAKLQPVDEDSMSKLCKFGLNYEVNKEPEHVSRNFDE